MLPTEKNYYTREMPSRTYTLEDGMTMKEALKDWQKTQSDPRYRETQRRLATLKSQLREDTQERLLEFDNRLREETQRRLAEFGEKEAKQRIEELERRPTVERLNEFDRQQTQERLEAFDEKWRYL